MSAADHDAYWFDYLAGHARAVTRVPHYLGLFSRRPRRLYLSLAFAWWAAPIIWPMRYFVAYFSHERVDGNRDKPCATRPMSDVESFFRMLALELTGQPHHQTACLTPEYFAARQPWPS